MGRSGGGGSHGGGSSHSSFSSSSHSHSSHSVSRSTSRSSSSGRSGRSYYSSRGSGPRPPVTHHVNHYYYGGGPRYYAPGRPRVGCLTSVFLTCFIVILLLAVIGVTSSQGGAPNSTVNRERLEAGSFTSNCVVNEIDWVREDGLNESRLGSQLQSFWNETGIQPYVYFLPENSAWDTADERFDKADEIWVDDLQSREDCLLLVYFDAEPDGNFEMVKGHLTGAVMDSEAEEIFWSYLDRYWSDPDNYSVQDAIRHTFQSTGERIMTKSTTGMDVMKYVVIGIVILLAAFVVIKIMRVRRQHAAEEAAETERILNTPLDMSSQDSLVDKYSDPPNS